MRWIGSDEAGKGDYFGGLAVAAVFLDDEKLTELEKLPIKESKKVTDVQAIYLSEEIKKLCVHEVCYLTPKEYNKLYSRTPNLNHILAWLHSRVVMKLLNSVGGCDRIVIDQFADPEFIKTYFPKGVPLVIHPHGEEDPAVMLASLLARATFLEQLNKLSESEGIVLPKGASTEVELIGREFVLTKGEHALGRVAKLHFKTTEKLLTTVPHRLWAPWRIEYIVGPRKGGCIFCDALKNMGKSYVLYRSERAFVVMNIFPYNNGHLMVAPVRHIGELTELTTEELMEVGRLVQASVEILRKVMHPHGFNIGINVGKVAGAGVVDHVHVHVVPRWLGDTNFMPVIGDTKVISVALDRVYEMLKPEFDKLKL